MIMSKNPSFGLKIEYGDLVIVYERHDVMKAVTVREDGVLQNRYGVFKHSEWVGKPYGSKVFSNKGGFVYILAPTPELWTSVLSHRTQILYVADISFIITYLEVVPGCLVLESGTGSGSSTTSLARAVSPSGHVHTFEFHEQRALAAREDFERIGVSDQVTVTVRDVQSDGFPEEYDGHADSVLLDLPQPWLAVPSASTALRQDGTFCSFSPCIEQVQRTCEALQFSFTDIRTFEVILRTYEVHESKLDLLRCDGNENDEAPFESLPCKRRQCSSTESAQDCLNPPTVTARPCGDARGHTGYLTFARKDCLLE